MMQQEKIEKFHKNESAKVSLHFKKINQLGNSSFINLFLSRKTRFGMSFFQL
jgi:hypothetical protein